MGKTYILKKFGAGFPACHYVNFEKDPALSKIFEKNLEPKRIVEALEFYLGRSIDTKKDFVIFDEIQACPLALTSLKYFQEELPELHLCGAGSLLGIYLTPLSFPVGKVDMLTMRPLSFEEFLLAVEDERGLNAFRAYHEGKEVLEIAHEHLWEQLKYYFIVGGMPEAVSVFRKKKGSLFEAFTEVRKKQRELLLAYYADIAKHSGKVNALHIERVLKSIPMQLQHTQDGMTGKFKFKGVIPGVSHYQRLAGAIDWLEAAGLILKVSIANSGHLPSRAYAKENAFKLLLFDIGMLGSMSGLSPHMILEYDYGSFKGFFAESFAAQEMMVEQDLELFCWMEKSSELEFLREWQGKAIPIEVKSGSNTRSKSLKVFNEKYHPFCRIILSGKPYNMGGDGTLIHLPLYLARHINDFIEMGSKDRG
ncbi:MAG: AAA family ATPase [Chlamydiia bacterium]|nr:AAA family ATPase [Chlamydiia bacterium]